MFFFFLFLSKMEVNTLTFKSPPPPSKHLMLVSEYIIGNVCLSVSGNATGGLHLTFKAYHESTVDSKREVTV